MNRRATAMTLPAPEPLGGRRQLATEWWGERWVDSLEDPDGQAYGYGYGSSGRDARLARGRTYARQGSVGEITVRAGYLAARVKGSRRTPYRCEIHVPELPDATWETLLDAWAATGPELLRELAEGDLGDLAIEAALAVEVLLTPLPDEFTYFCSCPDWGDPCKHAAALSYAFAQTLDTRHDALLTLRGRPLEQACVDLATRLARQEQALADASAAQQAGPAGLPAARIFAQAREAAGATGLPDLPAPAPVQQDMPSLTVPFTGGETIDPAPLRLLVADAAQRAAHLYAQLTRPCAHDDTDVADAAAAGPHHGQAQDATPAPDLFLDASPWHDAVRRAAACDGDPHQFGRLLNSSDQARTGLARAAVAWRHGGEAALATLDGTHMPSPEAEAAARHQLRTVRLPERSAPPRIRRTRGRLQLTGEGVELRWGPDERWYPYRKDRGQWWAAGPPAHDAAEALRGTFAAG
ncbi:SWIM zinc finger family protein [Streptomyces sp. NPDC058293]|uniref:SWIM zinc finger family protein n=1 Tax=Streptomyces sp. NPDC058293 TaxID=3346429 RepID=UPI0036E37EAE